MTTPSITITQSAAERFELKSNQTLIGSYATLATAMLALSTLLPSIVASMDGTGLLPETWHSTTGLAFRAPTGDGRDFSSVAWSWRDPATSTLPLMLLTENEGGHYGATWVGYFTTISDQGGTVAGAGRIYDNPDGVQARDMMLEGRTVGVSIDPGPATTYDVSCTEYDADGYCVASQMNFLTYEILGVTIVPFPAFADAAITIGAAAPAAMPMTASAARPVLARREWFSYPEPELGDPRLVPQLGKDHEVLGYAVPLTVTEGQVYGHLHFSGQCHTGFPDQCVSAPTSPTGHLKFNQSAGVRTAEGEDIPVGNLHLGCDHADVHLFAQQAKDHYAHSGLAWADVRAYDGVFGTWVCGAVRDIITEPQLEAIRASSISGDWRDDDGNLELITGLTVSVGGFPIQRHGWVLAASHAPPQRVRARTLVASGRVTALVASGIVRTASKGCGCGGSDPLSLVLARLDVMTDRLAALDVRTRPMIVAAAAAQRARLTVP